MNARMKLFISWSGAESRQIAEALRDWLPALFESVDPYMSARDNDAGVRWGQVISGELEETDFGILCLTPTNLQAPWLLFEAGALSKAVDVARVVPLLHRLTTADVTSPLSQFQMKELDEEGAREVVRSINNALTNPRAEAALLTVFSALWPSLRDRITAIEPPSEAAAPQRPEREILEEILTLVRQPTLVAERQPTSGAGLRAGSRASALLRGLKTDDVSTFTVLRRSGIPLEREPGRVTLLPRSAEETEEAVRLLEVLEPLAAQEGTRLLVVPSGSGHSDADAE